VQGIHHITAFASDPQANVDFYHMVLGQRLVKTTVNFDDPGTYHFYYGDKIGTPGTIMTYFPWPRARRGVRGNGEIGASAYTIGHSSTEYWRQRLADYGVPTSKSESRFGAKVISFQDPDGMALELIASEAQATYDFWAGGPIPAEHALRGFHGVTLWLAEPAQTGTLLSEHMGYQFVGQEDNRWRYRAAGHDIGLYVDILVDPHRSTGRMGAGSVHHVAFRTRDDSEQLEYQRTLATAGFGVTEVKDRQYFQSIYFRSPGGVLFEIATDAPGFAVDEPVEALGQSLKLPAWLESRRDQIESILPEFTVSTVGPETAQEPSHV
jgi:glyoxalase family protein